MVRFTLAFLILTFILSLECFSQKPLVRVSQVQEIAVLSSYYADDSSRVVVTNLDEMLFLVFQEMRRFSARKYNFRLSDVNFKRFVDRVRRSLVEKIAKSEEYIDPKWGTVTITPKVLDDLVNSFTIVVPNLKIFEVQKRMDMDSFLDVINPLRWFLTPREYYVVTIGVSINFLDPNTGDVFHITELTKTFSGQDGNFFRLLTGRNRNLTFQETVESTLKELMNDLKLHLRGIDKFKLYSTLFEVSGGKNYMELGRNYDIHTGMELEVFLITETNLGGRKRIFREEVGLARVVKVHENFSEVIPIVGHLSVGYQLVDTVRSGFVVEPFLGIQIFEYYQPSQTNLVPYIQDEWVMLRNSFIPVLGVSITYDQLDAFFEPQITLGVHLTEPGGLILETFGNYSFYLFGRMKFKPKLGVGIISFGSTLNNVRIDLTNYTSSYDYVDVDVRFLSLTASAGLSIEVVLSKQNSISFNVGYRYSIPLRKDLAVFKTNVVNEEYRSYFNLSMLPDFIHTGMNGSLSWGFRF